MAASPPLGASVQVDVDSQGHQADEQSVGDRVAGGFVAERAKAEGEGGSGEGEDAGAGVLPADGEDGQGRVGEEPLSVGGAQDSVPVSTCRSSTRNEARSWTPTGHLAPAA
ncbi:hypothetical protein GCM10023086_24450 [Streptomyces venetus]|uniref:Uncharacterized protein n=1 Tax=Streptomyces venetus TaxID=1701086 RepID=A0ABP8FL33_9ACTN